MVVGEILVWQGVVPKHILGTVKSDVEPS